MIEQMARIFLNYRRDDTSGHAGRLFDKLQEHWPGEVFLDVESIAPGRDFRQAIFEAVRTGPVMVSLIGCRWVDASDDEGLRRLEDPEDSVRMEIEAAIAHGLPIIPVLFDGAEMPKKSAVPDSLRSFVFRNAIAVSPQFHTDSDRLIAAIKTEFDAFERENPKSARPDASSPVYTRVLYEPFDDAERIADEMKSIWLTSEHPAWTTRVADGHLEWVNASGTNQTLQSTMRYVVDETLVALGDGRVEAKVRVAPPNDANSAAGLLFRFSPEHDCGYAFMLQPGNVVTLFEREGNSMRRGPTIDVTPDPNGFVKLRAAGDGPASRFFVNDKLATTVTNSEWPDGLPGVMAYSTGCFAFDDFALFQRVEAAGR